MADRTHRQLERFAGGWDRLAISDRHWLREGPFHYAGDASPFSVAASKADRMLLDPCVGCIDEHRFEILDVPIDAGCEVSIRPIYLDVLAVTLMEPNPLLIGKDSVVERIERCEVLVEHLLH